MRVLRVFIGLLLLCSLPAWSQVHDANEADARHWQIYGGPTFSGDNPSGATFGAGFGIAGNFSRWVGAGGEFTFIRTTCCVVNNIVVTDFLVGPRFARPFGHSRVSPFADFLFGGQHLSESSDHHSLFYNSGSGPAVAADGGLDLSLTRRVAFRGQAGYLYSRFSSEGGAVGNSR